MENPKTRNKKETKPKSNLNLSNNKTQYKVFHIQIWKKGRKMYRIRFDESLSCKETPNHSARRIFFWILEAGEPRQQHPLLQAVATVLFESSPYFASESTVVTEGWSEASSVGSFSSSSSRRSSGRDSSSSSVIIWGLFRVFSVVVVGLKLIWSDESVAIVWENRRLRENGNSDLFLLSHLSFGFWFWEKDISWFLGFWEERGVTGFTFSF